MEANSAFRQGDARGRRTAVRAMGFLIGIIAAASLVFMTMVTVVDVIGRYLFNAPLTGADELTVVALAVAVFSGLPLAIAQRGMISVEVLTVTLSPRLRHLARIAADLASGAFLSLCAWQIMLKAEKLASYGDATMFLRIPTAPLAWAVAGATLVSALVFFGLAISQILAPSSRPEGAEVNA